MLSWNQDDGGDNDEWFFVIVVAEKCQHHFSSSSTTVLADGKNEEKKGWDASKQPAEEQVNYATHSTRSEHEKSWELYKPRAANSSRVQIKRKWVVVRKCCHWYWNMLACISVTLSDGSRCTRTPHYMVFMGRIKSDMLHFTHLSLRKKLLSDFSLFPTCNRQLFFPTRMPIDAPLSAFCCN